MSPTSCLRGHQDAGDTEEGWVTRSVTTWWSGGSPPPTRSRWPSVAWPGSGTPATSPSARPSTPPRRPGLVSGSRRSQTSGLMMSSTGIFETQIRSGWSRSRSPSLASPWVQWLGEPTLTISTPCRMASTGALSTRWGILTSSRMTWLSVILEKTIVWMIQVGWALSRILTAWSLLPAPTGRPAQRQDAHPR